MAELPSQFLSAEDEAYLTGLAEAVLEASRVPAGVSVAGHGPNTTGYTLIRPGGRNAYPAFWIRDYAMSLEARLITPEEQHHALFLTAEKQVDETIVLPTGSVLPPGSIADHISFGGVPIFFPGILEDYEAQGGPRWGLLPSLDDHFYFIHMAAQYAAQTGQTAFLRDEVRGKPLMARLEAAYAVPPARLDTGLVYATEQSRGVNFGFFDTTVHTGDLFFCSLLKYRAARELAAMLAQLGDTVRSKAYENKASALQKNIVKTFAMDNGFFRASTEISGQTDVWGTAFAVYIEALPQPEAENACAALARALRHGTISWEGGIRHVPTDADFSESSAWEQSYAKKNRYQNGAYWNTPVGWVCYAVAKTDFSLAKQLAEEYVTQVRKDDFRQGEEFGSPWECMHPEENHRQNPVYLTSVTAPLAVFRKIACPQ